MFYELLAESQQLDPGTQQKEARKLFPSVVAKSYLEQRLPDSPIPLSGKYIILGIATYSRLDLQLLDDVEAAHVLWENTAKVAVFDIMECKDLDDVKRFAPSTIVSMTPIVVVFNDGKLVESKFSLNNVREVLQSFNIS